MTKTDTRVIQQFTLLHCPCVPPDPRFDDPCHDAIKASPPVGCTPVEVGGLFGLDCRREAPTLLEAVAAVCAEVTSAHGIALRDLSVEKLWEFSCDGPNGWGATIVGQLLLMAAERGALLGYSIEDLIGFLSTLDSAHPDQVEGD
ncbi:MULTISPECIES: hypothetical protein [unclassified Crossiella]|uniref:hypothetical protein n=1 Tax=unclassified Crossiella TaxID=2620835 RepID=UPI002000354A|nr:MULTISPECIES: hypothetical protein [unclassified Crossiella]MCK2245411.1 hypothetical protein [Crossiella sp. S99.2]MCK2259063.1 hypothetical protein [Crossiella sp. S99.1]